MDFVDSTGAWLEAPLVLIDLGAINSLGQALALHPSTNWLQGIYLRSPYFARQ